MVTSILGGGMAAKECCMQQKRCVASWFDVTLSHPLIPITDFRFTDLFVLQDS